MLPHLGCSAGMLIPPPDSHRSAGGAAQCAQGTGTPEALLGATPSNGGASPLPAMAQRVLVIGPSNLGDAVLASDVITQLHTQFPAAHLAVVVGSRALAFFNQDSRIHTLVDVDLFDAPLGRLKLAWSLWRYHPQIVVDLRHTLYPLLLTPWRAWRFFRQPPRSISHWRDRYLWKLHAQVPSHSAPAHATELWHSEQDAAHVAHLWKRWQLDGTHPVVILCPGARSHIKRWLATGFSRVADRLIEAAHAVVILSGEPAEHPIIDEVAGGMTHRPLIAVGLTTPRQLGVLMQRSHLVITNDSASLHLASAAGATTLALFGPTDPAKYGPTAPRHRTMRRQLFCTPCEQSRCRFSHECMRFLDPDEVYEAAVAFLHGAP